MAVTSIPARPSAARVERLDKLAALHFDWVVANAEKAGFDPKVRKRVGGDYPLHHVDLDAPQTAMDDFLTKSSKIFAAGGAAAPAKVEAKQLELPIAASGAYDAARVAAELASAVSGFVPSWPALARPIVSGLVADVGSALSGGNVGRLASLTAGAGAVTALGTALGKAMRRLAARAARRAAGEVSDLGVQASAGTADDTALQGQADVIAHLIGQTLSGAATQTALLHAGRNADAVAAAVQADLDEIASLKSGGRILQNLEAALAAAQGAGRMATFALVEDRVQLMAREEPGACASCEAIDGKVFPTFAAAARAYPQGRHLGCLGRSNCRGGLQPVARMR